MMNINIDFLNKELVGTTVPVPISGTLSGHAAGEPFDKHVYKFIKRTFAEETFRQFEYLNKLYRDNPSANNAQDRFQLIKSPALAYLINRGKDVTEAWTNKNEFSEKQNDTADVIVAHNNFLNIIDVKTFNVAKNGQAPNIISAVKLAHMCALMIDSNSYDSHDIVYVGISWEKEGEILRCTNAEIKRLFQTDPTRIYINWAAAMQVQFHIEDLDQSFSGTIDEWCREYLKVFVEQAKRRVITMTNKFVTPFERYLE